MRGSLWSLLGTGIMLPVNLVTGVVLARLLGPADLGQFVVLTTFLQVVAPFVDLGFGAALLQWAGRAAGRGDSRAVTRLLQQNLGMQLLLPLPITAVVGVVVLRDASTLVQVTFLSSVVLGGVVGPGLVRLVVENRTAATAKLGLVAGLLSSTSAMGLAALGAGPTTLWASRSLVSVLPGLVLLLVLTRSDWKSYLKPQLPRRMPVGFWSFARASWLAAGLGALVGTRSEAFLLTAYDLDVQVGIFAVAFGLATQITAPLDLLQGTLGPAASAVAGRDESALTHVLARSRRVFGLGSAGILALSSSVVALVPTVYGEDYVAAQWLLVPLLLASCFQTALAPYAVLAVVRRRRRLLPSVQAVTVVADLGLAAALIPIIGVFGAVIGACAGLLVSSAGFARAELGSLRALCAAIASSGYLEGCLALAAGLAGGAALVDRGGVVAAAGSCLAAAAVLAVLLLLIRRAPMTMMLDDLTALLPPSMAVRLAAVRRVP